MTKNIVFQRFLLLIFILFACNKINYYPDETVIEVKTKFLAHRGGGHSGLQENTLEAVQYGLEYLDGVEVDIQLSKDRTIWLAHNAELEDCDGIELDCFPEAYDYEIIELDSCKGEILNFSKLEEVFKFISENYPEKYISLDVKAWYPCKLTSLDITGILNVIADEIIRLVEKYNLNNQVMVESETATFLNYIKKRSKSIECYLTTLGDFERGMLLALEAGYSGISFKYKFDEEISAEHIKMIRKKGLKIQLWTINSEDDILEALLINPDFIQTDNINYIITID